MINVLMTVVWLGTCTAGTCTDDEIIEFGTVSMEYCEALAKQIMKGDGAYHVTCTWQRRV